MKEIIDHLQEKRQIELAKSILESKGYKVEKKLSESDDYDWYLSEYDYENIYCIKGYCDD